jgi:tRNA threonylcarbamoyladenosine biosynthesis protein TsaB
MILLAIDTATEMCSAALWVDGKLLQKSTVQPRLHAEFILPFIDELLDEAKINKNQIDGLVVGQGPGAFTGVRIGIGVAQGLALALNIPVAAVSNLQTLAFAAYKQLDTTEPRTILVATDARMNEVYWAKYQASGDKIKLTTTEQVTAASFVDLDCIDCYIGSGFSVYEELKEYANNNPMPYQTNVFSQAKDMLLMVKDDFSKLAVDIDGIEPVYLREP